MARSIYALLFSLALTACGPGELDIQIAPGEGPGIGPSITPPGAPDPLSGILDPRPVAPSTPLAPPPPPDLPELLNSFMSGNPAARDGAGKQLARLGPAIVTPFLDEVRRQGVKSAVPGRPSWQAHAVTLMSELGPGALPALQRGLGDPSRDVRLVSVLALALMGSDATPVRASIERALSDPDPQIRLAAIGALQKIDPPPVHAEGEPVRIVEPGGERHER